MPTLLKFFRAITSVGPVKPVFSNVKCCGALQFRPLSTVDSALKMKHINMDYQRIRRSWSDEETEKLVELVQKHGPSWTAISKHFDKRSPSHCFMRYKTYMKQDGYNGPWSAEEVDTLRALCKNITSANQLDWQEVRKLLPVPRPMWQIKQKWQDTLNPQLNYGKWSEDEVARFEKLLAMYGVEKKWDVIAAEMKTRNRRQCYERWRFTMCPTKGHYSEEENAQIMQAVAKYGDKDFALIRRVIKSTRTPRHLSQHYRDALDPNVDRSPWTDQEEMKVYNLFGKHRDMVKVRQLMGCRRAGRDMWNHYYKVKKLVDKGRAVVVHGEVTQLNNRGSTALETKN
ncbi:Myb-like DNA-binding domain-containing protein [Radiomyces spectabilis]|uniref:Myb-like DNA-binding domain-containing protein n=1 Tax=Radiomyces spectabilis TaxID=64574 RepID=UPI00221F9133|nr:Myb-like DNA-binding domain-containing protein [Radiomyces spectabilis]KAI8369625.1 Myb-like DNA-binding domain-containing protein [Radiomyces spectabilis]